MSNVIAHDNDHVLKFADDATFFDLHNLAIEMKFKDMSNVIRETI